MKFRNKPIEIEARKVTSDQFCLIDWLPMEMIYCRFKEAQSRRLPAIFEGYVIESLEGNMFAAVGDWIIKGIKGEFYPCKADIFEATYEEVIE